MFERAGGKQRKLPLAALIIVPFLTLLLFFFSAVFMISFSNFRTQSLAEHRRRTEELHRRIGAYLELFFADPLRIVLMNEDFILSGRIDPEDLDDLAHHFSIELRRYPYLTFVSMGFPTGEYIGANRPPDGSALSVYRVLRSEGRLMTRYLMTEDGKIGAMIDRGSPYDARNRAWYRSALANDEVHWYPAYRYATSADYGMGVSKRVMDRSGATLGVLTGDVALTAVNRYLQGLLSTERGLAWVADADGRLIASSADLPIYLGDEVPPAPGPKRSPDEELYDAAMEAFREAGDEGRHVPFRHEGHSYQADLMRVSPAAGLNFSVGVAMPESAFVGDMARNGIISAVMGLATLIVSALLGVLIALEISRPVKRIQERAARLAAGDWSAAAVEAGPARELAGLADAFESMAQSLKASVETLEDTVSQRTAELRNLLREVHHRMKNNFSLAAAMLSLQATQADSAETAEALEEARDRILSMALLYDRLYRSADAESAAGDAYIAAVLDELRRALIDSRPIRLGAELGAFALDPGKAAGVGIIVTELVTNACKYAFPGNAGGEVIVRASPAEGKLVVEVEDDGCGFPEGFSPGKDGGFGWTMVQALTDQYGGETLLDSRPGRTRVRLTLNVLAAANG